MTTAASTIKKPQRQQRQPPIKAMHTAKMALTLSIMLQITRDWYQSTQNQVRNPEKRKSIRKIPKPLGARLDPQKRTPTLGCDAPCVLSLSGHDPPQPYAECIHTVSQCHTATQMGVLHLKISPAQCRCRSQNSMTGTLTPQILTPRHAHNARLCSRSDQVQQVCVTAALLSSKTACHPQHSVPS